MARPVSERNLPSAPSVSHSSRCQVFRPRETRMPEINPPKRVKVVQEMSLTEGEDFFPPGLLLPVRVAATPSGRFESLQRLFLVTSAVTMTVKRMTTATHRLYVCVCFPLPSARKSYPISRETQIGPINVKRLQTRTLTGLFSICLSRSCSRQIAPATVLHSI